MDVRKTHLYKTLLPCIRKEDQEAFRRELQQVVDSGTRINKCASTIQSAFIWLATPQGHLFWSELHTRLLHSGNYAENEELARRRA